MARKEKEGVDALQFIDTSADVQSEASQLPVEAGVAGLRVMYRGGSVSMPVTLSITTSTGTHRGVHMSRLVRAAGSRGPSSIEEWLKWICTEVNASQPGSSATCSYELPYGDQFARVTVKTTQKGAFTYSYSVDGMTACPCSKKMIGIGHMQRARLTMTVRSAKPMDSMDVVGRVAECFSASPKEELKRVDESKKILEAQANPRFAEDLVRECVKRFPGAMYVSARCLESIHAHDAIASWSSRPGWAPSL